MLVDDGKILAVGANLKRDGGEIVDCNGHCLAPGLVDMRVQLREPGEEHQETMVTGGKVAAAGGVTTMVALPNTDPVIDEQALVEFVARRSRDVGLTRIRTTRRPMVLLGKELTDVASHRRRSARLYRWRPRIADAVVMRRALSTTTLTC